MESHASQRSSNALQRQLSHLKLVSRLLSHELHAQNGAKTITLSRDEVQEIQNTLDLFIEEAARRGGAGGNGSGAGAGETRLVGSRN